MSLVGPRAQVAFDVALYTDQERALLCVRPGITDYASIRFRNEGEILSGESDPDEAYSRLIRPEKIRLGLKYVAERSLLVDIQILANTARAVLGVPGEPLPAVAPSSGSGDRKVAESA
jgi:lipopolysaccharide/colanic/teichoic acid biosynthesis glycosyltransferase